MKRPSSIFLTLLFSVSYRVVVRSLEIASSTSKSTSRPPPSPAYYSPDSPFRPRLPRPPEELYQIQLQEREPLSPVSHLLSIPPRSTGCGITGHD
ncbi:hypothetical protein LZ30DRAFT_471105 [Colletotrichum cereale]|nr:hypothetical protein LZ30DRAFT_471105 [Colletotrichum cereale]